MAMKKFINSPESLTTELLEGYCHAFSDRVKLASDQIVVRAKSKDSNKVAIVTLGGAGHEPALSGFVGEGLLDASVVGDIFAAPGPPKVIEAFRMFKDYAGILFVVLNHAGDVMSANVAMQMAEKEGIYVRMLLTHEDIAPGADAPADDRRGLVGCMAVYKAAGAAAEEGRSLDEVFAIGEQMRDNMATLAVALRAATHPQNGEDIFELEDDEMEIGMGQHGEAGTGRSPMLSADETTQKMFDQLVPAVNAQSGDQLFVVINGAGATTHMELFIVFRCIHRLAKERGLTIAHAMIGEYLTVQEMAGFQMFVAKVDDELTRLIKAPSNAPYWVSRGSMEN